MIVKGRCKLGGNLMTQKGLKEWAKSHGRSNPKIEVLKHKGKARVVESPSHSNLGMLSTLQITHD